MTRNEYFKNLREAWEKGKISEEAYDAGIRNAEYFCDDDDADEEE